MSNTQINLEDPKGFVHSIRAKYSTINDLQTNEELYQTLLDNELWLTGKEDKLIKFSDLEQDHIINIIEMLNTNGKSIKVRLSHSLTRRAPQFIEKLQTYIKKEGN